MTLRNLGARVLGLWVVLGLLFPPGIAAGVLAAPAGAPVTELAAPLPEESPVVASGPTVDVAPQEMPDPDSAPALLAPAAPLTYTNASAREVPTTPPPAMTIRVTPECVAPGDIVTLTLTVAQPETAARLRAATITATLPAELHWLPQRSEWAYTDASRGLQAALPRLDAGDGATYTMQFQADGKPGDTLEVAFALVDVTGARTTAKAEVWVSVPAQADVTERGGSLESADGRVQVTFPAGVVAQPAVVVHTPRAQRTVQGRGAAQRFDLDLYTLDGKPLPLNTPVTVTLNVSGLLDLTPSQEQWPYLAYLDEQTGEWQRVPVRADADAGTLTARLEHFSTWETGMDGLLNSGWRLLYNAPQVSTFSGAATFAYPIEVLPGAGGLQPQVALSYNSRRVDGAMSWIQSDWAGLGWSVDTIEIARQVGRDNTHHGYSNIFTLIFNGTSYHLVKDPNSGNPAAYGRYYTAIYSGLYIVRCNVFATNLPECATPASNLTGEYWVIRTPQGLTYRLGDTLDSEQVVGDMYWWGGEPFNNGQHANAPEYAGSAPGRVTYRWRVREVRDNFSHKMVYVYTEEDNAYYCYKGYDMASYLSEIRYNYTTETTYDSKIVFSSTQRQDDLITGIQNNCATTMFWQNYYLSAIQIMHQASLVRQYNLEYQVLRGPTVPDTATPSRLLTRIQEYYPGQPASLPATTFNYTQQLDDRHGNKYACWWADNGAGGGTGDCPNPNQDDNWIMMPWWTSAFPYFRLSQVANGYGGVTQFDYLRDGHGNHDTPHSYIVTEARTLDGLGNTARTTYAYANGCWDHDGQQCHGPGPQSKTLAGYNQVTVAQYDYNSALLSQQQHFFHLDYSRLGRAYRTQTFAPHGTLLTQSDTAWGVQSAYQGNLTYAGQTLQTTYAGGLPTTVRQDYTYDPFGNVTAVYDYGAEMPVLNGSFEAGLENWAVWQSATGFQAVKTAAAAIAGQYALQLSGTAEGAVYQDVAGLIPGVTYEIRLWVKAADANTSARFRLAANDTESGNWRNSNLIAPAGWEPLTLTYTANATGKVRIDLHYYGGSGQLYVDGVALARVSDVGDERTVHSFYHNLPEMPLLNGGFEPNLSNWSIWEATPGFSAVSSVGTGFPGNSLRLSGTAEGAVYQDVTGLIPGITYQISLRVKAEANTTAQFQLLANDTTGANYYTIAPVNPTSWTTLTLTYTANATGRVRIDLHYYAGSGELHIDNVTLAQAITGNTPGVNHSTNSLWLLGLKKREILYSGIVIGTPAEGIEQQTLWYYDDFNSNYDAWNSNIHLTCGQLTMVGQGFRSQIATGGFITTTFAYDPYGNLTDTRAPGGSHTQVTYDTIWHQYPIQQCQEQLCTTTEYYGVNANGAPAGGGLPGQVWRTFPTQFPAQATRYKYDAYGRLQAVQAPDDTGWSMSQASVYFEYAHLGAPGQQRQIVRTGRNATWQETFFDGLGRTLQVHQRAEGTQEIRTTTQYNALGQPVAQWTPYFGTHPETGPYGVGSYVPPASTLPRTQTLYNALGQAVQVRPPDGAWQTALSVGTTALQLGATQHPRIHRQDSRGQLAQALELLPSFTDNFTTLNTQAFAFNAYHSIDNGKLKSVGANTTWDANFYRTPGGAQTYNLNGGADGQSVQLEFRVDGPETQAHFMVETSGTPADPNSPYYRFGVQAIGGKLQVQYNRASTGWQYPADLVTPVLVGAWYVLRLTVLPNGELALVVWQKDNPSRMGSYQVQFPAGLQYRFRHWIRTGTAWIDNYQEFTHYTTDYTYDLRGNLTHVTDALTNTTVITYNLLGQKIAMLDPDMGYWTYGYDAAGNLARQTDARNQQLCFTYDPLNRLTGKFALPANGNCAAGPGAEGYLARYDYNALGQRDVMTDTTGSTAWQYDLRGRLITETKTIATVGTYATRYQYNPLDQVTHITYPDNEVVAQTYTVSGLPKTLSGATTYVSNATYNALGQPTAVTWGNGLSTQYTYDALNLRLQRLQVGALLDLRYGYDRVGNLTHLQDQTRNEAQRFTYDVWERLTGFEKAATALQSLTIRAKGSNADGWPVMQVRVNGAVVTEITVASSNWSDYTIQAPLTGVDEIDVVFTNDYCVPSGCANGDRNLFVDYIVVNNGVPIQAEDPEVIYDRGVGMQAFDGGDVIPGQESMLWHGALRFRRQTGATPWSTQETYAYNAIGNLTHKNGQPYLYTGSPYTHTQPHAVRQVGTGTTALTYVYDKNGNMIARPFNGQTQTLLYNAENRLQQVTANGQTTTYFYDGDGRLVKKTAYENLAAGIMATSNTTLHWPEVVTNGDTWADSGAGASGEFAYTGSTGLRYVQLDLGGIYTIDQIKVWHFAGDSRTYNATKTQVSADGVTWYTVFDSAVSGKYVETAAGKTHSFAPRAVRYVRDYLNGSNANTGNHWVEIEVWGQRTTVYVNALYEHDVTANVSTKYYYFGGQRIAMRRGGTLTYLHGDHLGSASLTTNASGGRVSLERYLPYGGLRVGGAPTDRQYTGQRHEATLGFYDYNARQYDPVLGRFLQADTIVPQPGNPQSLNRYAYTLNNPLRYTDPTGHWYYDPSLDALVHTRENRNEHPDYLRTRPINRLQYQANPVNTLPALIPYAPIPLGVEVRHGEITGYNNVQLQNTALAFELTALVMDGFNFGLSLFSATTEVAGLVAAAAGVPEGLLAVGIVDAGLQTLSEGVDAVGTASSVISDLAGGYTRIDWQNTKSHWPEIVIGQNTVDNFRYGIAQKICPSGIGDAFISGHALHSDLTAPHNRELRWTMYGILAVSYQP